MSMCAKCISGVRLEGTPEGKIVKIGGIDSYTVTPAIDYPKDAVVIFLTDAFGIALTNSQLLSDDFANTGLRVVAPDLFSGEPVPLNALSGGVPGFDFNVWFNAHSPAMAKPMVEAVMDALKEEGVTKFFFTGYCFGARLAFDLAFDGKGKAIAVSHPSIVEVVDFEKYRATSKAPLLLNTGELDDHFDVKIHPEVDAIMKGFAPGYKRNFYEGCDHGWAVRGDTNLPHIKAGKDGTFKETALWFFNHMD